MKKGISDRQRDRIYAKSLEVILYLTQHYHTKAQAEAIVAEMLKEHDEDLQAGKVDQVILNFDLFIHSN